MSYGVALRNGVPFTLGTIAALCTNATGSAWSPADLTALGAWFDPSDLSTMFNDSAGTTPVATPGTVADSANPVGLIQDKSGNGHHASQSTSTARPLLSARVNLLTYTEDFSNAVWYEQVYGAASLTKTPNYSTAPDGTLTACRVLIADIDDAAWLQNAAYTTPDSVPVTRTVWMKSNTASSYVVTLRPGNPGGKVTVTPTWTKFEVTLTTAPSTGFNVGLRAADSTSTACDISIWHPQCESGTTATTYQRVTTDSDYDGDPAKFPYYLSFDGVDDYLSTSAFTTVPQPITYFVGVNPTTKPLVGHITDGSATGREFIIFGNSTVEVNAGTTQAAGDYFAATSQINTMVFNGALSAWNRNGDSFTTINPGTQGIDRLFIGANYLGGNTLKGNLYQLIFGAAVYGAPTILEAETWVAEKTGVTL